MSNKPQNHLWRHMQISDLADICQIASVCHPDYPEDEAVLAEKFQLSPKTCFILEKDDKAVGYLLAHPWLKNNIPPLNCLLKSIPENANVLYLHDIAILPQARAGGAGGQAFAHFEKVALSQGLHALSLVAVNGSAPYWKSKGFSVPELSDALKQKLLSYSGDALYMVKVL